jgi:AcrR family transcriptional regulator
MPRKPMASSASRAPVARRGYGGRSAQELLQERRERLLEAGLTLFCTLGYQHTRIDVICAEAKVTPRHFYEQFDTREALLLAFYEQVVAHAQSQVQRALQTPGLAPSALINEAIRAFVQAYTADARHARLACIEVVGVSADMARRRRAVIHEFASLIEAYANAMAQAGLLPKRSYGLSCVAMVGAVNELMCEWLTVDKPPSVAELTDELLAMFAALILGARALLPEG